MPESDEQAIRDRWNDNLRTEAGQARDVSADGIDAGEILAEPHPGFECNVEEMG